MTAERMAADAFGAGPGMVLADRYRLLRLVGEGGMGRVFLADDEREGARVAVKVLADDRPIPKAAQRFEREARAIARIDHENVVRVYDVGHSPRGGIFYVMEYLEGEELASTLEREGPLPWTRVRHFALQVCGALQAAHEQGIVHRDLKLENCFRVARDGDPDFVKILDFGVVKLLSPELEDGERLTNTGATLGTPAYMAPELCRGKKVDHRVDVYALGVMIYELLTGGVPFEGESFLDVALKHMNEPPPPLSEHVPSTLLPEGLEAVVMRAMAKAREDRFPTMAAFGRALLAVGEASPAEHEPEPTAAAGGTLPVIPAAGGTMPALPGAIDGSHDHDDEPHGRRRAWPWVLAAAVVGTALLAWWSQAGSEPIVPEPEPRASVVEAEPLDARGLALASSGEVEPTSEASTTGEPREAEPRETPTASPGLSSTQIEAALRRVQPKVSACAGVITEGRKGDRVRVTLQVDRATGKVTSARASRGRSAGVETCVEEAVRHARFAVVGRGSQKIVRTIEL